MIKESFFETADSLFRNFKNKPVILSSIKALQLSRRSDTALWSHGRGRGHDAAALEGHRGLRVFLTAIGWVYRRKWYSPIVHFYLDGVHRYDCKRGAVNNTAHERTHTRRGLFSVFQKLYRENPAPSVQIVVNQHRWCACNGWLREWIYCQVQGGRCFPWLPQLPLHNTPTSIMRKNAKHERDNGCGTEDCLFYSSDLFKDGCSVRIWGRLTATTLSCCHTLTWDGLVGGNSCRDSESSVRR